jgi:tRNA(adenine34) deaminase
MALALEEARAAEAEDEVPVGAVVVWGGAGAEGEGPPEGEPELLARAHNRTRALRDPTAHAEVLALRAAAARVGDWRLTRATLYVTLEPCAMCAGAIVLARVRRLVYGAADPKAGMCGTLANLVQDPRLNHRVELVRGVCEAESAALLAEFFRRRREREP